MEDDLAAPEPGETTAAAILPDGALTEAQQAEIRRLAARADALVEASLSANTRKAYGSAWRQWSEWCLGFGLDPTGAGPVPIADASWLAMHLTALSENRKLSTIELRRAAVLEIRRRLGFPLHFDDAQFRAFLTPGNWGLDPDRNVRLSVVSPETCCAHTTSPDLSSNHHFGALSLRFYRTTAASIVQAAATPSQLDLNCHLRAG